MTRLPALCLLLACGCRELSLAKPPAGPYLPAVALVDAAAFTGEMVTIAATPPPDGDERVEVYFEGVPADAVTRTSVGWRATVPLFAGSGVVSVRAVGWRADAAAPFRYLGPGHVTGVPAVRSLAVPTGPRGVAVAAGVAAVVAESVGSLRLVRLLDRKPVLAPPRPAVVGDPAASPDGGRLAYLASGGTSAVVLEVASDVAATTVAEACDFAPGGVAAAVALGPALGLVSIPAASKLVAFDSRCTPAGALLLDVAPGRLVSGGGAVLVLAADAGVAVLVDPSGPRELARTTLAGQAVDAVYDSASGGFEVLESDPPSVARLSAGSLALSARITVPPASRITRDQAGALWLAHPGRGAASIVSGGSVTAVPVGGAPFGAAAAGEVVAISDQAAGALRGLSVRGGGAEVWRAPLLHGLGGVVAVGDETVAAAPGEPFLLRGSADGLRGALFAGGALVGAVAALADGRVAVTSQFADGHLELVAVSASGVETIGRLEGGGAALAVAAGTIAVTERRAAGWRVALFSQEAAAWSASGVELPGTPVAIAAGTDGFWVALDGPPQVAHLVSGGVTVELRALGFAPAALSVSARTGGQAVAEKGAARVWLFEARRDPISVELPAEAESLHHSPDGAVVYAVIPSRGLVAVISTAEARVVSLVTGLDGVASVASSADGMRLFITSSLGPELSIVE